MSLPHDCAHTHVRGESEYIEDRLLVRGEVWVGLLYSPHAKARIERIDSAAAREVEGVVGIFTGADFAHNRWGTIFADQPLLATDGVNYAGEAVALVAGTTVRAVREGLKRMVVEYTAEEPILSITAARAQQSFIGDERTIERGEVAAALAAAPHRLTGHIVIKGAEHFYLENQAAIAYPQEGGQLLVFSSTQHPTEVQHVIAHSLALPDKDVVVTVKRMGGGFGGKESQASPFGAYVALVAQRLRRPARLLITKDEDMIITGKRNPFENDYEVGFNDEGRILGVKIDLFSDGGAYADLSTAIMERAMLHCDNAYFLPAVRIRGRVCRTHFHPHTAFRGFGGPKGVATIELILERIAAQLGRDPLDIRKINCYAEGGERSETYYGQVVENNCLPTLFAELERDCEYRARRENIARHNEESKRQGGTLRGLSLTAVKFGISFTTRFLNQGNALVVIHRDGTIQVSTGATEMGQGVNARVAQVVAEELGLPRGQVRVMPTSTDKNANTSPTAASAGTDLNASAAVLAVRKIKARLSELAERLFETPESLWASKTAALGTAPEIPVAPDRPLADHPNPGNALQDTVSFSGMAFENGLVTSARHPGKKIAFKDLVVEAFLNRISISDYAHYRVPHLSFNKITGRGRAFLYYTQGVAASEVSVDPLTGEVKVLRVDILMDLGRPINEDLDIGQVSGGFVQGMGWVTTENLFYSPEGMLLAHSPSTYKIPSVQDTPRIFNLRLLANEGNADNIRGTKAVGEPPLLLSLSVWTAIGDAIRQARGGVYPEISIPATSEVVLRALTPERFRQWEEKSGRA